MNMLEELNGHVNALLHNYELSLADIETLIIGGKVNSKLIDVISATNIYHTMVILDPLGKYVIMFRGIRVQVSPDMSPFGIKIKCVEHSLNLTVSIEVPNEG
jgi:hypothetical protein